MRCVIQRVSEASVTIDDKIKSSIGKGLLVLVGIEEADNDEDIEWLCGKISKPEYPSFRCTCRSV